MSVEPKCPYPCGWEKLHTMVTEKAAYFAVATLDDDIPEQVREAGIYAGQIALELIRHCRQTPADYVHREEMYLERDRAVMAARKAWCKQVPEGADQVLLPDHGHVGYLRAIAVCILKGNHYEEADLCAAVNHIIAQTSLEPLDIAALQHDVRDW